MFIYEDRSIFKEFLGSECFNFGDVELDKVTRNS